MRFRRARSPFVVAAVLGLSIFSSVVPAAAHPEDPGDGKRGLSQELIESASAGSPQQRLPAEECQNGMAGTFPCENVDMLSFVPLAELGGGTGNDIWGWTDPQSGHEYAIMGTSNGTSFVDVTKPEDPVVVGHMPTASPIGLPLWRDIKVHDNHAFVVSEHDAHGMQVFDLTRLRDPSSTPAFFTADTVYKEFNSAHNLAINEQSGFAYAVGTDTCEGGLHVVDMQNPSTPRFAGCIADDGYTHDVQCVDYHGPDVRFQGREICFASNEDTVTIWDVTDKNAPELLSRTGYPTAAYTHQGWLTPDHRWFLFGDELDESEQTVPNTTTYIMDATTLTEPAPPKDFQHSTPSIDHNLYIHGNRVFESNYTSGLRVMDYDESSLQQGQLRQEGFFDVAPATDAPEFLGTWSNYPYLPSGNVVVSGIESGLFVLRPQPTQ